MNQDQAIRNNDTGPQRLLMGNGLLQAAIEGNEKELRRLLGFPVEICSHDEIKVDLSRNDPDQFGTDQVENVEDIQGTTYIGDTILHILATHGHSDLVSMCYQKEPSLLRSKNNKLETPLHCAANAGHEKVVSKLIELASTEGVDTLKEFLKERNHNEETALHEAAKHGHASVASVLMEKDPELAGMVNKEKVSPLYVATARGSIDVVQTMVEVLSDREVEVVPAFYAGPNGQTALHAAVLRDAGLELQQQLDEFMSRGLGELIEDKHSGLSHQFTRLILQLRSVRPLAKEADDTGSTPLHFAASVGCYHLTKLLLEKDPSLGYLRNLGGQFPVHAAAAKGHVKTIIVLLQRCTGSYQLLDSCGKNFFHIAAEENRLEVFKELLLLGKSRENLGIPGSDKIFRSMMNTGDNGGNTPLHLAVQKRNNSTVLVLQKYKMLDLGLQNKRGLTAVDLSAIESQKRRPNLQGMQFWIEEATQKRNIQFSPAWFEHYIDGQKLRTESAEVERTESAEVERSSIDVKDKIQIIGLGSVLIATVAFAAAFTVPGGYNSDNGVPVLGRKSIFKAFILADVLAFALSFLSTAFLILCCTNNNRDYTVIEETVETSLDIFAVAAKCLAMAMALGLYVVLAPICKGIAIVAFVVASFLVFIDPMMFMGHDEIEKIDRTTRLTFNYLFDASLASFFLKPQDAAVKRAFRIYLVSSYKSLLRHSLGFYGRAIVPLAFIFLFAKLK